MERLEEFISKNRQDLDPYDPDPALWKEITKELDRKKRYLFRWFSAAAVFVAVLASAFILYVRSDVKHNGYYAVGEQQQELKETEIFYSGVINSLYQEAEPFLSKQPDIRKELLSDMSRIDSLCTEIKKDLKDNISNQEVIEALVQNYRIKISILEDMLAVLRENQDLNVNEKQNGL